MALVGRPQGFDSDSPTGLGQARGSLQNASSLTLYSYVELI